MDSLKNQINLLKHKLSVDNQKLVKYSDVIKEKLKHNKKDSILKKFDHMENFYTYFNYNINILTEFTSRTKL